MAPNTDKFNAAELEAPEWLNSELFAEVLQQSEQNKNLQVENVQITPASLKGDHYGSVMFRATVNYAIEHTKHTKSMIIKSLPEAEGIQKELLQNMYIFETENDMYDVTIPRFERVLRAAGDNTVLGVRLSPRKYIILEDIVPLGYTVVRDRSLTVAEVKGAYQKLAKFHAISYKLIQQDPNCLSKYKHGVMNTSALHSAEFIVEGIHNFIELLQEVPTLRTYQRYFEPMTVNLIEKCRASFSEYIEHRQPGSAYVLCHGDFHYKNMMFKHDPNTQALQDVMLIDYQASFVGPQAIDIIYSLFFLLSADMRLHQRDAWIQYYFEHFVNNLKLIGFDGRVPELQELKQQLAQHRHYEIFAVVTFLPLWYGFNTKGTEPEKMMASNEYRKTLYRYKPYLEELHQLLPYYKDVGYLEV